MPSRPFHPQHSRLVTAILTSPPPGGKGGADGTRALGVITVVLHWLCQPHCRSKGCELINNVYDAADVCGDAACVSRDAMLNPVYTCHKHEVQRSRGTLPLYYIQSLRIRHFYHRRPRDVLSLALASTPLCARAKEAQGTRDRLRACPPHRQLLDTTEPGVQSGSLAGMESAGASHLVRRRLPFREHETASTFSGAPTSV